MISQEIRIDKLIICQTLIGLKQLKDESSYFKGSLDCFTLSDSKMSDSITKSFNTLQSIEKAFNELVVNTINAMEYAGISFDEAEQELMNYYASIVL